MILFCSYDEVNPASFRFLLQKFVASKHRFYSVFMVLCDVNANFQSVPFFFLGFSVYKLWREKKTPLQMQFEMHEMNFPVE